MLLLSLSRTVSKAELSLNTQSTYGHGYGCGIECDVLSLQNGKHDAGFANWAEHEHRVNQPK